ncbi:MAG: hypothetical protein LBJ20_03305 [Candidatus Methanoplasma sp.]|jgi:RNase P/RNase MRP subunit POP5|nr:hypothetical protein [Candidatus Methanoplasma sp.]
MVIKSKRGRRRYIAFRVSEHTTKIALVKWLSSAGADPPYVVQCIPGMAVLRCPPERREETIALMHSADPFSAPLKTSGTLRTLRDKFPELKAMRKDPPNGRVLVK